MGKWGTNPKVEAARERKEQQKQTERARAEAVAEDAKWVDNDKLRTRKEDRAHEKLDKAQNKVDARAERKALEEAEAEELKNFGKTKKQMAAGQKVTKAQISADLLASLGGLGRPTKKNTNKGAASSSETPPQPVPVIGAAPQSSGAAPKPRTRNVELGDEFYAPNPNRVLGDEARDAAERGMGLIQATGKVDDVLSALHSGGAGGSAPSVDTHPERRLKAAWKAFEERRLKELKVEMPGLKKSQYNERIFKEWKKSPENPVVAAGQLSQD